MRRNEGEVGERLRRRFITSRRVEILVVAGMVMLGCAVAPQCHPRAESQEHHSAATPEVQPGMLICNLPTGNGHCELHGTMSVGSWLSKSSDIQATAMFQMSGATIDALFKDLESGAKVDLPPLPMAIEPPSVMKVRVSVASFRGESAGMDRDMQAALNEKEYPDIAFVLKSVQGVRENGAGPGGQSTFDVQVLGELSVAGVARETTTDAIIYRDSRGQIVVHAEQRLRMSDFGVKPPIALFGLISAGDEMSVVFDLDFVSEAGVQIGPGKE
jgi:hypothetical protein